MFSDLVNILFPRVCAACGEVLLKLEQEICLACTVHLPKTDFHKIQGNPVAKIFWGRIEIENAFAYYHFHKGNKVQHMLHQLKYKGAQKLGEKIGQLYGHELINSVFCKEIDFIVPVPLHPKKLKKRGYNQSESFAKGLSQTLNIPFNTKLLTRAVNSETQTKKNRFNRWENVSEIFCADDNNIQFNHRHILLVDDVITTGATIEACARDLKAKQIRVSVAAIASTQ